MYEAPDQNLHEEILSAVLPLAKRFLGKIKVYLCPTTTCADALNAFGLTKADLPRAVIDDTAAGNKFVQPKPKSKKAWKPTLESLEQFIDTSLGADLPTF